MDLSNIFVTVGTTEFDDLINEINSEKFADSLIKKKCSQLVIQIGRGSTYPSYIDDTCKKYGISFCCYRYKPSLIDDMKHATFIISHAGKLNRINRIFN